MSLSFPASPSNGQVYQNWIWSSAVGAWQPNFAAGFVNSFNGRGGVVTFQPSDNTSGQRVLLSTSNVSTAVSSVDFFTGFDGTYAELALVAYDVVASADNTLYARFSSDGSTFDATTNYLTSYQGSNTTPGAVATGSSTPGIAMGSNALGAVATNGMYLRSQIRLAASRPVILWQAGFQNSGAGWIGTSGAGCWTVNSQAAKGLRLILGGGTINRGTFLLFGIRP